MNISSLLYGIKLYNGHRSICGYWGLSIYGDSTLNCRMLLANTLSNGKVPKVAIIDGIRGIGRALKNKPEGG
ncbi:MAG: hypothetical protein DDT22_01103 [candidate division WS2 bacterium]|nr:hypothetical protein [Candidatus Lithacetigena glycinireducens]MBT9175427.1 hypothetical protein [Candidatus Lithacetigena glycinireducens]